MRCLQIAAVSLGFIAAGCRGRAAPALGTRVAPVPGGMEGRVLANRFAYIPPQCYTATRDAAGGVVHNPCYPCHLRSVPPNFVDDGDLQLSFKLPPAAAVNPWRNLFAPPVTRARRASDDDVLAYVRRSNYFDAAGEITLAQILSASPLPAAWDGQGDHRWDGYVPDARFQFDARGFDRTASGLATGWRAFAYTPFPGTFFPTNGSTDDVLIRLDPALREDATGRPDDLVYTLNLAITEALIARADVAIDPVDEAQVGADLDLDGVLGRATRVAFRPAPAGGGVTPMRYVGRAAAQAFAIEPGLFPLGTEFLHSVRYLDVAPDGQVTMAARMKELRYMNKVRWLSSADLKAKAAAEVTEQAESAEGVIQYLWQFDRGIYNAGGWLLQGFIEAADGTLRPQSYEESVACVGCHGEIGATTDAVFSFSRKLGADARARGWYHARPDDLHGLPEPRRRDGRYEYTFYLATNGAGDDLRENQEIEARFFDDQGRLRQDRIVGLHADIATLLVPSAARALDLDRATWAIVREQGFALGRDAILAPSRHVHRRITVDEKTGVDKAITDDDAAAVGAPATGAVTGRPLGD